MYFFDRPGFIQSLDSLKLVMKNQARGIRFGESRSRFYGSGVEVSHLKNYSTGEDVRFIDWNASFRLNRTFIKVFCETRENNVYILMDSSASMDFGEPETKRGLAVKLAYCVAYLAAAGSNRIYAADFADSVTGIAEITRANINQRFREIVDRDAKRSAEIGRAAGTAGWRATRLAGAINSFIANFKRRGLALIISDFFDDGLTIIDSVARLSIAHNFCLIQTLCAEDLAVADTGEYKYEDSETLETVEISLTPEAAAEYRWRVTAFRGELEARALKYGGAFRTAESGCDHMQVLKDVLLKTGFGGGAGR